MFKKFGKWQWLCVSLVAVTGLWLGALCLFSGSQPGVDQIPGDLLQFKSTQFNNPLDKRHI